MDEEYLQKSLEEILFELHKLNSHFEKKKRVKSDIPANRLVELWNIHADKIFPRCLGLTQGSLRCKSANSRWGEMPNDEYWISVINRINLSRFCRGSNDRYWRADFDFLVRPGTHHKVLEGKYDDKTKGKNVVVGHTSQGQPVYGREK